MILALKYRGSPATSRQRIGPRLCEKSGGRRWAHRHRSRAQVRPLRNRPRLVDPKQVMSKAGARPGDRLVLTKALRPPPRLQATSPSRAATCRARGRWSAPRLNRPASRTCATRCAPCVLGYACARTRWTSGAQADAVKVPLMEGALSRSIRDTMAARGEPANTCSRPKQVSAARVGGRPATCSIAG